MATTMTIAEQVAQLDRFGRLEIRRQVDTVYTIILEANRDGFGVVTFRVHVERKNGGNLGVGRGLCERRAITDLDAARAHANLLWTNIRNGARP